MKMKKFKRKQKKQMAALTFTILAAALVAIMLLTPMFDIKEISVYGNSAIGEKEIIRSSGIVKGINIFGVSLSAAKDNIKSMGYIESVKIKRRLPSTIDITVVEEVGVAYIKAQEGYAIITADGRCIDITDGLSAQKTQEGDAPLQSASAPKLPLVKGLKGVKYKVGNILKSENGEQLQALFTCLHEFSKQGYVFDMREIDMSNLNDIKFYYKSKDLRVSIGTTAKIGYKMECFGPILEQIGENPKGYIDLERLTYRKAEAVKSE